MSKSVESSLSWILPELRNNFLVLSPNHQRVEWLPLRKSLIWQDQAFKYPNSSLFLLVPFRGSPFFGTCSGD